MRKAAQKAVEKVVTVPVAPPPDPTLLESLRAGLRNAWSAFDPVHWVSLLITWINHLPLLGELAGYLLLLAAAILAAGVAIRTAVLLGEAALIGGLWFVDWASGMIARLVLQVWAVGLAVTVVVTAVALWPLRVSVALVTGSVAGLVDRLRRDPEAMPEAVRPTDGYAWALGILDLEEPFTQADFKQKYRGLQSKVHPDHGEMPKAFAQMANQAADIIRQHKGWRR